MTHDLFIHESSILCPLHCQSLPCSYGMQSSHTEPNELINMLILGRLLKQVGGHSSQGC